MIDEGDGEALRIECGTLIPSSRVVRVLDQLIEMFGRCQAILQGSGPAPIVKAFVSWVDRHCVKQLIV